VTVTIPALHIAISDVTKDDWQVALGEYKFMVGGSSCNLPLSSAAKLKKGVDGYAIQNSHRSCGREPSCRHRVLTANSRTSGSG